MSQFVRVVDGVVAEIMALPSGFTMEDVYPPEVIAQCVSAPDNVQEWWTYDGTKFSPPASPPVTVVDLATYAAAKRYAIETGGIAVNGSVISTDRQSQSLITGAYNYVQANPSTTVKFKTADGFVELTPVQMMAIANAVGAHVQAAFAAEESVVEEINEGTISTMAEIDMASWPSNG